MADGAERMEEAIPRQRWKVRIGGTVDSPTPTVPICSDSTSVICSWSRN